MGTVELNEKNFREVVEQSGIVLIDWWASWCAPCRAFAPIFEEAADEHSDIVFGKVNTEEHAELAQAFDIQSIPTLMIFRDRVLLFAQPGSMARPALEDLIRQVRNLDMAKVRQKIEEHERSLRN